MATLDSCRVKCMIVVLIFLLVGLSLVTWLLISYNDLIRNHVKGQLILKDDNKEAMQRFISSTDADTQMSFYIYNVSNIGEYDDPTLRSTFTPRLKEIGPFVFDLVKYQTPVSLNETTITYKPTRQFIFNPYKSNYSLETKLVVPNVPVYVAFDWLSKKPLSSITLRAFNAYLRYNKEDGFIRDTAAKLLFDGSHRPVFDIIKKILDQFSIAGFDWPLKDDNFGFMYGRNVTWDSKLDGNITIARGVDSNYTTINDLMAVKARDGQRRLSYWNDTPSSCNSLNGTVGTEYPPFINVPENLDTYQNDLCRSLKFTHYGKQDVKGISTVAYRFNQDNFNSNLTENVCFCIDPDRNLCQTDGLIDLRTCLMPLIYGSQPHFEGASRWLIDQWPELPHPNSSRDVSQFFVEPTTGISLMGVSVFQYNVFVPSAGTNFDILKFAAGKKMVVPMFWLQESASIRDEPADSLLETLQMITWLRIVAISGTFLMFCGVLMALSYIMISYHRDGQLGERAPLAPQTKSSSSMNEEEPQTTGADMQSSTVYGT